MLILGPAFATVFALFGGHSQPADRPIVFTNSARLGHLIRGGNIYLSLRDAIALALENNLDIETERYTLRLADADLERARSGRPLRGLGFLSPPPGVPMDNAGSPGFDPVFSAGMTWNHASIPAAPLFAGLAPAASSTMGAVTVSQRFLSGTQVSTSLISQTSLLRGPGANSKPAAVQFFISQPLLSGYGVAHNSRPIQVARNQSLQAQVEFEKRVIATVSGVAGAYWELVGLNQGVEVARRSLHSAEKLYEDNKAQVGTGVVAPIELVRAEAEIAARRQDLTTSSARERQVETVLKDMLTRNVDPAIGAARIITTDRIDLPEMPAVEPAQDLIEKATRNRPELDLLRSNMDSAHVRAAASKNALLPSLSLFAGYTSNVQASAANAFMGTAQAASAMAVPLTQIFAGSVPDYQLGFQLSIPLRNRSAEADYATNLVELRRSEIDLQRARKQIALDVQNAIASVEEARARYNAAVKQRVLEQQAFDADEQRHAAGMTTAYQVIQTERDLVSAQANEVSTLCQYAHAQLELDRATGQIVSKYGINMDEARTGRVSASPASLLDESALYLPARSPALEFQRLQLVTAAFHPSPSSPPATARASDPVRKNVTPVTASPVTIVKETDARPVAPTVRGCKACAFESEGRRLTAEGRLDEALEALNRSIESDPNRPTAYNARGYVQVRRRQYQAGVKDFSAALTRNPSYVNAYQNRATAEKLLGDLTGASLDTEKARALQR